VKFIIDQQLPPILAGWLVESGLDATHVVHLGLDESADGLIWSVACQSGAVVISRDEDFVRLVANPGGARLVWVRFGNCDNPTLLSLMEARWPAVMERLAMGDLLIELRR